MTGAQSPSLGLGTASKASSVGVAHDPSLWHMHCLDNPPMTVNPVPQLSIGPRATALALSCLALGVIAFGASGTARANIDNFSFGSIEGVGTLKGKLSTRLGTASNSTEHRINIDDCELYAGGEIEVSVKIDPRPTGYQYAAAYAPPGKTCPVTDANPKATDGECYVPLSQRELTATTIKFTVKLDQLIGNACDSNVEGEAKLYIIIQNTSLSRVQSQQISIDVDLRAPAAPVLDEVVPGDARFTAKWSDDENDSTTTEYVVYYGDAPFGEDDLEDIDSKSGITTTSYAVESGLSNDATYYVSVAARDESDNESALSNQLEVAPAETTDFWEAYVAGGGKDPGGFCFIATAAYGTPMEVELGTLRAFRDQVLMQSDAGRWMVSEYYEKGRFLAAYIADKPVLRALVRVMLVPLVWLAQVVLIAGPLATFGLGLLALYAYRRLRRRALSHPMLVQELR